MNVWICHEMRVFLGEVLNDKSLNDIKLIYNKNIFSQTFN